jgi:HEAT repeat protein
MGVGHRETTITARTQGAEAAFPLTPEAAEVHHQRLGRWKGREASPEAQSESARFWRESGLAGIRRLVARLRDERHDDRLRGTASMLADLGPASLDPILEAFQDEPTADQALALLWALGWIGDRHQTGDAGAELVLVRYLFDDNPELREAAARATRLIPPQRGKPWLTRRLRVESDREVRLTIEHELGDAGAGIARIAVGS